MNIVAMQEDNNVVDTVQDLLVAIAENPERFKQLIVIHIGEEGEIGHHLSHEMKFHVAVGLLEVAKANILDEYINGSPE